MSTKNRIFSNAFSLVEQDGKFGYAHYNEQGERELLFDNKK